MRRLVLMRGAGRLGIKSIRVTEAALRLSARSWGRGSARGFAYGVVGIAGAILRVWRILFRKVEVGVGG